MRVSFEYIWFNVDLNIRFLQIVDQTGCLCKLAIVNETMALPAVL